MLVCCRGVLRWQLIEGKGGYRRLAWICLPVFVCQRSGYKGHASCARWQGLCPARLGGGTCLSSKVCLPLERGPAAGQARRARAALGASVTDVAGAVHHKCPLSQPLSGSTAVRPHQSSQLCSIAGQCSEGAE